MKKLIAISVMLALVAGAAFAQDLSIVAQAEFGTTILKSQNKTNGKDSGIKFGGGDLDAFNLGIAKSGDNAGGYMRFKHQSDAGGQMVYVYWQPVDIFKFKIGSGDGDWGAAKITGWGWTQTAKLGGKFAGAAFDNRGFDGSSWYNYFGWNTGYGSGLDGKSVNFDKSVGFYPGTGWNKWRLGFSIYPIDGLDINIAFTGDELGNNLGDNPGGGAYLANVINLTHLNVQYALSGIGTINVSAILGTGKRTATDGTDSNGNDKLKAANSTDTMKLFASFYLTAIDNMGLDIGVAYKLPSNVGTDVKTKTTYPIELGLGFTYTMGDFGVKARAGALLMGQTKVGSASATKDPMAIAFDILPYYNLGSTTVYFQAGINMMMNDKKVVVSPGTEATKQLMGWFVNPYLKFGPGGGIDMWVGLKVWGSTGVKPGKANPNMQWAVPLTVSLYMN